MSNICYNCTSPINPSAKFCPKCGFQQTSYEPLPHHLQPGTLLKDRYRLGRVLGEGGFGITYIAWDTVLNMKVALKEFYMSGYVSRIATLEPTVRVSVSTHGAVFEKNRDRFLGEARVLACFSEEEGIVGIRDFFEENNTAYLVMNFLSGITLKDYLKKYGTLTWEQTFRIMCPILTSLSAVHEQGIIHRDISPDNIMMTDKGQVKLLDFGAARNYAENDQKSLSVILKPGYAPEEQYRSKGEQGPWTDVYALCATMYCCLTGNAPDAAIDRTYQDTVQPPAAVCQCPAAISAILMKGLSVYALDRFDSVAELLAALRNAAVPAAPVVQPPRPPVSDIPTAPIKPAPQRPAPAPVTPPPRKRRLWLIPVLLLAAAAIVLALMLILPGWNDRNTTDDPSDDAVSSPKEDADENKPAEKEESDDSKNEDSGPASGKNPESSKTDQPDSIPEAEKPVPETEPQPEPEPAPEPAPEPEPPAPMSLSHTSYTFYSTGEQLQLQIHNAGERTVVWSTDDSSVVGITETGLVTARAEGSCHVFADVDNTRFICIIQSYADPMDSLNISDEISHILELNTAQVASINAGEYSARTIRRGVIAYVDTELEQIVAIYVGADTDGIPYSRSYYYDEKGDLYFAYYNGADSRRYYFYYEHLFRWRHTPDADIRDVYTDYLLNDSPEFLQEEETILRESNTILNESLLYTGLSQ